MATTTRRLALVLVALALHGCATRSGGDYVVGGGSVADRDAAACELAAQDRTRVEGGLFAPAVAIASYNEAFDACMRSKGYTRK